MLDRKITLKIDDWYKGSKSALLIDGARQIGKTTIIEEYFKSNGIDYVEFNLLRDLNVLKAFNTSLDDDQLMMRLAALSNRNLTPGKTIIFIDEIQEADDAITPLKFLVQKSVFRFIVSGSLLGVKLQGIRSIPAGSMEFIDMFPMDFEEFISAIGVSDVALSHIKDCFDEEKPVDPIVHSQMMNLFNLYLVVGGMPKAVMKFTETKDLADVDRILKEIDDAYRFDVAKYEKKSKLQIQEIYDLIPSELNSQNKRFILKNLNEHGRFFKMESSFAWIKNSGVGLFVHNVDNPVYPLLSSKERTLFKLFPCDVGMLSYKLFNGNKDSLLNGDCNLNFGAIYESAVAQELAAHGFSLFYNNDKKRGEIDFLLEKNGEVTPLEVKSGKCYKRHSAMTQLMENPAFSYKKGYVLCNGNIKREGRIAYMPVYMVMFLKNERQNTSQVVNIDISALI